MEKSDNHLSENLLKQLFDELFEYSIYKCVEIEGISQYQTIEDLISRCNNPILIQRIASVLNVDKLKIISSIARCVYESIRGLNYIIESSAFSEYKIMNIINSLINCENEIMNFEEIKKNTLNIKIDELHLVDEQEKRLTYSSNNIDGFFEALHYSPDDLVYYNVLEENSQPFFEYKEQFDDSPSYLAERLVYTFYHSIYEILEIENSVSIDNSLAFILDSVYFASMLDYQHELGKPRSYMDPYMYKQKAIEHKQKNIIKCSNILRERLGSEIVKRVNELLKK